MPKSNAAMVMNQNFINKIQNKYPDLAQGLLPGLLGYNLRRAQLAVFQNFQSTIAPFDITPGQFGIMILIDENKGLSQSELGNAMGIDRSTMVAVIDRLENRALVVRAPSSFDRRSYALQLSTEGKQLLDKIIPAVKKHEKQMANNLSEAEYEQLLSLLGRISSQNESK